MESLRMMGWGLVVVESSSAAVVVVAVVVAAVRRGAARPSLPPWGRPPEPSALALGLPYALNKYSFSLIYIEYIHFSKVCFPKK